LIDQKAIISNNTLCQDMNSLNQKPRGQTQGCCGHRQMR